FHNPDASPASVLDYDAVGELGLRGGATAGFPRITGLNSSFGGMSLGMGPTNANKYYTDKPTAVATVSIVRSNHTYKLGADWQRNTYTDRNTRGASGSYSFGATETGLPSTNGQNLQGRPVGFPYASFLLGLAGGASVNSPQDPQLVKSVWAMFVQDTWKVTRRLTLDYGLRWDYQTGTRELHYRTSSFGPTIPNPAAGGLPGAIAYEGYGPGRCDCQLARTYPYAIGPRIGAAYQIDDKTVLRAGWGITYGATAPFNYITNQPILGVGVNQLNFTAPAFGEPAVVLQNGLSYNPADLTRATYDAGIRPTPGQIDSPPYMIDPNGGRPPRIMQWSIGLQRQITKDLVVEAAYVGNRGAWFQANNLVDLNALTPERIRSAGLDINNDADRTLLASRIDSSLAQGRNFRAPYAGFPVGQSVAQTLRPFPQFGNIPVQWAPLGKNWYDSLQVKATKRYSYGLDFSAAFTWQKELTLGSDGGSVNDVFNRENQKRLSPSSQPYVFVTAFTYEIPGFGNRLVKAVAGGWSLGGVLRYASGLPIMVPSANNNLNSLLFRGTYANRVPGEPLFLKDLNCHCIDPNKEFVLNP
ncbi:MAG TPA: TonB-dependent receptor, partial [Bryobacteraceae bacterium]|nr:TonB-dependent receptor [Bryobacteraceae bacterium]